MFSVKRPVSICCIIVGIGSAFISSCGEFIAGVAPVGARGALEIQATMVSALGKVKRCSNTTFDSLIVEVSGTDIATMRKALPFSPEHLVVLDTLTGIPVGKKRNVTVTTVNKAGEVIHVDSAGVRTVTIEADRVTSLPVSLLPVKGSLYLQLTDIPTTVDSIKASFTADNGTIYPTAAKRKPKLFLSIDGIAHGTNGTLVVTGMSTEGDTLYQARKAVTVNAYTTTSVALFFDDAVVTGGALSMSLRVLYPGVTVASGSMEQNISVSNEDGTLLITEIMYAANDSEYVEVYNPGNTSLYFNTLILEIDGKERLFENVSVSAGGYYVFGRIPLSWVDASHSVNSALDLSKNGNRIMVKSSNGTIMDQVLFTGGRNPVEWPVTVGKQSIVLKKDAYSVDNNNYGRNWTGAESSIVNGGSQMGTPHY